jgi:hypothetical protein
MLRTELRARRRRRNPRVNIIKSRGSSVVKTRTSVREIPGSIPTIYEFSVWKESGAPPYKCARALLVFSK